MALQTAFMAMFLLLLLDVLVIVASVARKIHWNRTGRKRIESKQAIDRFSSDPGLLDSVGDKELFSEFERIADSIELPSAQKEQIVDRLLESKRCGRYLKNLSSVFPLRRIEATFHLKNLDRKPVRDAMLKALEKERDPLVILFLAHALALQKDRRAIPSVVRKLPRMNPWFAERVSAVLYTYGRQFLRFAVSRQNVNRKYLQKLICGFALRYPAEELKEFLVIQAQSKHRSIKETALKALLAHFPDQLLNEPFVSGTQKTTLTYVVRAYGRSQDPDAVDHLLGYSRFPALRQEIVESLVGMTEENPQLLHLLIDWFEHTDSPRKRGIMAQVLANRVDYLLPRLKGSSSAKITQLVRELVAVRMTSTMLFFLQRNQDIVVEDSLVRILRSELPKNPWLREEMRRYLDARLLKRLRIRKGRGGKSVARPHSDPPQRLALGIWLAALIVLFPVLLFFSDFSTIIGMGWAQIGKLYVFRFNYLYIYYSLAINAIYLVILVISFLGARRQARLWNAKDYRFLFTEGLLPSVSIIAPAYNEEAGIIESVNSLLNQQYPDFELLIVNDGSTDRTLSLLVDHFDLKKTDRSYSPRIRTRAIRGIYTNPSIPNLVVVDKTNGGKADSLNMGLNLACKEYFCGIDADSVLESDALLRVVSVMVDSPQQSICSGGNICPANGCHVEYGEVDKVALPKNFLARLQSMEYLRSFMAGRVGWARINSLLIISGAFGVFDKEKTIKTGGYLTKSGKYKRDTVGEDMELVVRLSRSMREQHLPYTVDYAFNANCWTEVPEKWGQLRRQRDRWHRGLIDILLFHRTLIGNPRYGRLGLVSLPYFFIFEFLGPFVEAQGLLMVIVAAFAGLLTPSIALLLFSATILLGVFVSLLSLFVSGFDRPLYSFGDTVRLVWLAVIENFGPRQTIGLWRVLGFFSAMKSRSKGWGKQVRKGFNATVRTKKT
jgi:cellulose synthase/poly-beta-1,6-N-acetylglucosamine synthase-like glycosyltransferase